ncbi:MAG: serine/threonine protein kinase [Planctomycetota bacterium]|nr:serine/threonine protein kinase [Planctomycetota bacterium]
MPEVSGYSFIGKIGNGPLGAVFRVRHNVLKRPMALKLILATPDFPAFGEEDRGRFKSDIESAAYLEHPNIAQVFAVGSYRDNPQVAQEFLAGGDLAKRTAGRPQDPKWAAATIGKLARALHAGHEKGICHRDLKPTNIVFTEDGEAKITDYGIARLMETKSEATKKGVPFGELCYMSPEQVKAEPTRMQPPSDVYSLGAILYELLCGKPPFPRLYQGVLTGDLMKMVVEQEPPPPSQVLSEVAKPLENIAMQSLRKDPGERYASAAEFADDLDRFLKGEKVRARSPGFFKRIFGW